jgi:hypothetical protein
VKLSEQIVLAVLVKRTCERRGPLGIDLNVFQSQVQSDSERDSERDSESEDFSTEIEIGRKRLRRRDDYEEYKHKHSVREKNERETWVR